MNSYRPPRPELDDLVPYDAKDVRAEVVLASNENPVNLPGEIIAKLSSRLPEFEFNRYPDPTATDLRKLIAGRQRARARERARRQRRRRAHLRPAARVGRARPQDARRAADVLDVRDRRRVDRHRGREHPPGRGLPDRHRGGVSTRREGDIDIVIIANPNNPTGDLTDESFLIELLKATDAIVLVDEAYFEFSRHTMRPHMTRHPNLVILRTFSKAFSLAGLRVGYLLGHADVVSELMKVRQPYSVDAFSQWVAATVFRERMVFEQQIRDIMRGRDRLIHGLSLIDGVKVFPTEANFVLFRVEHATALWRDLLHNHSVLVRDFSRTPGLEDCLRVTVGTAEENERFLAAVDEVLTSRRASEHFGEQARANRHDVSA